jgi:hypothetical protein
MLKHEHCTVAPATCAVALARPIALLCSTQILQCFDGIYSANRPGTGKRSELPRGMPLVALIAVLPAEPRRKSRWHLQA